MFKDYIIKIFIMFAVFSISLPLYPLSNDNKSSEADIPGFINRGPGSNKVSKYVQESKPGEKSDSAKSGTENTSAASASPASAAAGASSTHPASTAAGASSSKLSPSASSALAAANKSGISAKSSKALNAIDSARTAPDDDKYNCYNYAIVNHFGKTLNISYAQIDKNGAIRTNSRLDALKPPELKVFHNGELIYSAKFTFG